MMEWWGSNWQWTTGAVLALIGIVAAVGIALWQRRPKLLDYQVINNVPILAASTKHLGDNLTVNYKHTRLAKPHILMVRVINTGKRAVTAADYETPIAISFNEAPMLAAIISRTSDPHIVPETKSSTMFGDEEIANTVKVRPGLLNPGDWFDVQVVTDGPPANLGVRSRFADQARPMRHYSGARMWPRYALFSVILIIMSASVTANILWPTEPAYALALTSVALLLLAGALQRDFRRMASILSRRLTHP